MEAKEFIKEYRRMCDNYNDSSDVACDGCPAKDKITCSFYHADLSITDIVEEWSKENPTNEQKIKEVFGDDVLLDMGIFLINSKTVKWLSQVYKKPKKEE